MHSFLFFQLNVSNNSLPVEIDESLVSKSFLNRKQRVWWEGEEKRHCEHALCMCGWGCGSVTERERKSSL